MSTVIKSMNDLSKILETRIQKALKMTQDKISCDYATGLDVAMEELGLKPGILYIIKRILRSVVYLRKDHYIWKMYKWEQLCYSTYNAVP